MSDEIPEDVMKTARSVALEAREEAWHGLDHVVIARAIMAERERCAKIAEDHAEAKWGGEQDGTTILRVTAGSIAFAIRG